MATATKICRVCGKEYEACHTFKRITGVFRWQEVACSPECGSIYLAKIEASRAISPKKTEAEVVKDVTGDAYGIIDYNVDADENEPTLEDYLDD